MRRDITIQPLTAEKWPDLERLFGKRGACGGCWCMFWRLTRREFELGKGARNRQAFKALVESKAVPGLLAYDGDEPVGWCAVQPRERFPGLQRTRLFKPLDSQPVWSVTCLFVAKTHRRRGVSVELLKAAADHVRRCGGRIVEGYPKETKSRPMPDVFVWTGLASAFRQAGYTECARPAPTRPVMRLVLGLTLCATMWLSPGLASERPEAAPRRAGIFNVLDYGAVADGKTVSSDGINRAISSCAEAGGGQVLFPPGRYLSGTVHLRSHAHLVFEAGARLIGTTNLSDYQPPNVPSFMPEARWGKWHRALMVGESVEDVSIGGAGTIDGNKVFDPAGEEKMRGPHAIVFVGCRGFTIRDVSIVDAANYAIFFQASDDVEVRNVKFVGGWDGVHFRGAPKRWCTNVSIINCQFYTGDDSIAGRYWDNVVVSGCIVNSSCNGIRLIGPATRLIVDNCLFYGPGQQPHRSSARYNMLSGIVLQPGAWDKTEGLLDDVVITRNTMHNVASPVTIWTKPGNPVGRITVAGLQATGVYRSALSVESWSDLPITNVVFRNACIEFKGGGKTEQGRQPVKGPGVDARPLPAWGAYARNVRQLTLEDVRLSLEKEDLRPVVMAEDVGTLTLDNVKFTADPAVPKPLQTTNVGEIVLKQTEMKAE